MRQCLVVGLFLLLSVPLFSQELFKRTLLLMGSRFEITVTADDSLQAHRHIDAAVAEIVRIEKLISSWDEASQTGAVNKNAGIGPVKVSEELLALVERSLFLSKLTDGAFDISYASMDNIWKFDGSMTQMPSPEAIRTSVARVGYQNIIVDKSAGTVFLKMPGMKIGFGAIGKGYAADKAKALLMDRGVRAGIINASGDMNTWGRKPDGGDWTVAITNPFDKDKAFALFPIHGGAVATSGDYEKFVTFDGKRYDHIIDPKTGLPASGIISVTIFASSAEFADALATSVFVMGVEAGINRINQLPDVECIIIDDAGQIHTSDNLKIEKP